MVGSVIFIFLLELIYSKLDSTADPMIIFLKFLVLALFVKRLHDLNLSGWYVLVLFIGVFLIFPSGSIGENRFGFDLLNRKDFLNKAGDDNLDFTICSSCGAKCDDFAFKCPNCGEKFWRNRKAYEKFLKSRKIKK